MGQAVRILVPGFFRSDNNQRASIKDAIALGKGKINWAHICLGEIVYGNYAHRVMTTNFDQLVLRAILLMGRISQARKCLK